MATIGYVKADLNGVYVEGELISDDPTKDFVVIYLLNDAYIGVTGDLQVPRNQILEII